MSEAGALKRQFGDTVELSGEREPYAILAELSVNGNVYAILQSEAMEEDAFEVFRVTVGDDGNLQLETVEDDEEWEAAAEAYDDLQFGSDDQP